jgi:inositol oxygenase
MIKKYVAVTAIIFYAGLIFADFRDYPEAHDNSIAQFYYENHTKQTLDFVLQKKRQYIGSCRKQMSVWQALEQLNKLVDESDPDLDLPQIQHALQTAEAMRKDGHPRWFILVGLIHDLGKMLCFFDEPQWAVVGDTFPVGCAYSKHIVYPAFFNDNPDTHIKKYQTQYGIYKPHCGLEHVHMSWGHDEYLYHIVKDYLPPQAAYVIRYHSFYAQHQHNAYDHLLNEHDQQMFTWVKKFQTYDLYSKDRTHQIDIEKVKPYYQTLIAEFFPDQLDW